MRAKKKKTRSWDALTNVAASPKKTRTQKGKIVKRLVANKSFNIGGSHVGEVAVPSEGFAMLRHTFSGGVGIGRNKKRIEKVLELISAKAISSGNPILILQAFCL